MSTASHRPIHQRQRIFALLLFSILPSATDAWGSPQTSTTLVSVSHPPIRDALLLRRSARYRDDNDYYDADYDNDRQRRSRRPGQKRNGYNDSFYWDDDDDVMQPNGSRQQSLYDRYREEDKNQDEDNEDDNSYYGDPYAKSSKTKFSSQQQAQQQQQSRLDVLDWEVCSTNVGKAHVLLPPVSVRQPTAVVHFVGGTLFGSAPSLWYDQFLHELVQNTNTAIVATSIPVVTPFSSPFGDNNNNDNTNNESPLQHVALARKLQQQFRIAWRDVLVDEYGAQAMEHMPVCGMGHSLGARLLVVLATLPPPQRPRRYIPPPFKALVLISFVNFGAAAGIPGLSQLNKASRRLQREQEEEKDDKNGRRKQNSQRTRRRDGRNGKGDYWYNDYEDYDDSIDNDDEDWGEIFADLGDALKEQATKIKTALTPSSESLEFHPTPDQLWKAIAIDGRYNVSNTLLVQFDDDEVDQSAKLAASLQSSRNSTEVYFSRIRGTHLTPVMPNNGAQNRGSNPTWVERFGSRLGLSLARILTGRKRTRQNDQSLLQLRQVVSSYVIEMVTKGR